MRAQSGGKRHYTGTIDAWQKIYREEGMGAFFRGAWSNVLRGAGGAHLLCMNVQLQKGRRHGEEATPWHELSARNEAGTSLSGLGFSMTCSRTQAGTCVGP